MDFDKLQNKFFDQLGIEDPDEELVDQLQEYLSKIVIEVVLRRASDSQIEDLEQVMESGDEEEIEETMTAIAASIPGLSEEIEAAVKAEEESIKRLMSK